MTDPRLDVLCIGNAIVDVIADADDDFLDAEGLTKGSMRLIDAEEAERLYSHMGPAREISGGSAGNTAAGIAALGGKAGFIGQVAHDQLGEFYRHDLTRRPASSSPPSRRDFGEPDRALDGPGHARRPADDEHLPRRRPASAGERARRGADPLGRRSSISKAICGTRKRRARRWSGRSRSRARPAARSPSPCPTASASTATATASTR